MLLAKAIACLLIKEHFAFGSISGKQVVIIAWALIAGVLHAAYAGKSVSTIIYICGCAHRGAMWCANALFYPFSVLKNDPLFIHINFNCAIIGAVLEPESGTEIRLVILSGDLGAVDRRGDHSVHVAAAQIDSAFAACYFKARSRIGEKIYFKIHFYAI